MDLDYLKVEAKLNDGSEDAKRVDLIKLIGFISLIFAFVFSIYLGYVILENWIAGLFFGVLFTAIYFNFNFILLSTIRKADFISQKNPFAEERTVILDNAVFVGDGKRYPETFLPNKFLLSVIVRFAFLGIFSSFLAIGAVLLTHIDAGKQATENHKNKIIANFNSFIDKSYFKKSLLYESTFKKLSAKKNRLEWVKDSLGSLFLNNPTNANLREEVAWSDSDLNDFNTTHFAEMNFLQKMIYDSREEIALKKSNFKGSLLGKFFFIQKTKYIFQKHSSSASLIFIITILFFFLPFTLRFAMLKSKKYLLDDKLQDFTIKEVVESYALFCDSIDNIIQENKFNEQLTTNNLSKWSLIGDHFENPPFNTIPKLDKKTILRKDSLGRYFLNSRV